MPHRGANLMGDLETAEERAFAMALERSAEPDQPPANPRDGAARRAIEEAVRTERPKLRRRRRRRRALAEPEGTQWTADQVAVLLDYLGRWRDRILARQAAEPELVTE